MKYLSQATRTVLVVLLLVCSARGYSQNIDIRILRALNSPESKPSDNFFRFVSNSDAWIVFGVPVVIGADGLIRHDNLLIRNACVTLSAVVIASGVTVALKYSVNRERPFVTYPDIRKKSKAGSPSFPSGHTSSAFSLATSLSMTYPKWYIIAPSFIWASTVAWSRMDLGVHYPSDVLAGAAVGAGSAWLTHYINKKLQSKH